MRGGLTPQQQRRAEELLFARLSSDISLDELARECGLSRSHFARAFHKSFGTPPHRWLMVRRLERARELLETSAMPIAEVAERSGFASQSHLTRVFSGTFGVSPGQFRRARG
jgi:AraC-like DNA-binding protein